MIEYSIGDPYLLGAILSAEGTNFSVFACRATGRCREVPCGALGRRDPCFYAAQSRSTRAKRMDGLILFLLCQDESKANSDIFRSTSEARLIVTVSRL